MKSIHKFIVLLLIIYSVDGIAQTNEHCKRCNMLIKDELHKARAIEGETQLNFDAIECLINYLKNNTIILTNKQVINYESGEWIDAADAFYLKSKAIPSPMGAYLSAFKTREEAQKVKRRKGGETYNWEELKARFANSDFGSLNHQHHHQRADAHAPIGVMGDHLHYQGGLMISLRYMNMFMQGNRAGSNKINDEVIYSDYMVAPQQMQMNMYMLGLMYAPTDKLTFMLMQNFHQNKMELTAQMKMEGSMMNGTMMEGMLMQNDFETATMGFGDTKLAFMYGIVNNEKTNFHLNASINIPLGSIEEKDATPMNNDTRLPYRMQLGSGTFDYSLGGTFKITLNKTSLGSQLITTIRSGMSNNGYRWGNQVQVNIWGAYLITNNVSFSTRIIGTKEGMINGNDDELGPMMIPTANASNYGGQLFIHFGG